MSFSRTKEDKNFKSAKEDRLVVLAVFGVTLLAVFGVTLYRDREEIFNKVFAPKTIFVAKVSPSPLTPAQKLTPTSMFTREVEQVKSLIMDLRGNYGVYVQDLITKENYGLNYEDVFPSASLNKLPVLLTLYQEAEAGRLNLETKYSLREEDKRTGAGSLQYQPAGAVYSYRKMAELMGRESDNTAFNVFSKLLGPDKIQKTIDNLGMRRTSFKDFTTSPEDIGTFFYKLYKGGILDEPGREELLSFLTNTWWEDRIPKGIPKGVKVSHKVGTEIGVIADAGIVFAERPYLLVILSEGVIETEAREVLPKISELVYQQENQ